MMCAENVFPIKVHLSLFTAHTRGSCSAPETNINNYYLYTYGYEHMSVYANTFIVYMDAHFLQ